MAGLFMLIPVVFAATAVMALLEIDEAKHKAYVKQKEDLAKLEAKIDKVGKRM